MRVNACPARHSVAAPQCHPGISRVLGPLRLLPLFFFVLAAVVARPASAQVPLPISVERQPGAEDCPDTAGLVARVEAILGRGSSDDSTPYRVTFTHSAQAFTAAIRLGSDGSTVRWLDAREPTCAGLAHATAIALAVLFDADLSVAGSGREDAPPPDTPSPPPPATPPPALAKPKPNARDTKPDANDADEDLEDEHPRSGSKLDPQLSVGGAGLVGVLRPIGYGLVADLGLEGKDFRGSIGALWVPPETLTLAPGSARESILSGTLRGCYALARGSVLRFDLCTGALLGVARAQARGFTVDDAQHNEIFLAFPAELALSGRSRFIGWELGASALLLCPPNEFKIEGLDVTYRPQPVAGMFTLRVFVEPFR